MSGTKIMPIVLDRADALSSAQPLPMSLAARRNALVVQTDSEYIAVLRISLQGVR